MPSKYLYDCMDQNTNWKYFQFVLLLEIPDEINGQCVKHRRRNRSQQIIAWCHLWRKEHLSTLMAALYLSLWPVFVRYYCILRVPAPVMFMVWQLVLWATIKHHVTLTYQQRWPWTRCCPNNSMFPYAKT